MTVPVCRACRSGAGRVVLDLGPQPPCDHFPLASDPGPDPVFPLRMWLCSTCRLAQLAEDATEAEEPRAIEPEALLVQAADAVKRVADAGWLPAGGGVVEFGSPHGGSWLDLLAARGLAPVGAEEPAEVVIDCFGMMHAADQREALERRVERMAPAGMLLIQYHSLATILRRGQWNALRHGHFAYYSTTALVGMLAGAGLHPRRAWQFTLYGGTVLLAATLDGDARPDPSVSALLATEAELGIDDPDRLGTLQAMAISSAERLHNWLVSARRDGRHVLAYGAGSRAVALLCRAGVDVDLLPAVADASPAKIGRRLPGTHIPVMSPDELLAAGPDDVVLLLPDLLDEVRVAMPGIEAAGARWIDIETIASDAAERPG